MGPEGRQDGRAVIPKFASFKPEDRVSPTTPNRGRSPTQRKHASVRPSHDAEPRQRGSFGRDGQDGAQQEQGHRRRHKDLGSAKHMEERVSNDTFEIDRKGDYKTLTFESLDRGSLPAYTRIGRGNIIGLPTFHKIEAFRSQGAGLFVTCAQQWQTKKIQSLSETKIGAVTDGSSENLLRANLKTNQALQDDFVSFEELETLEGDKSYTLPLEDQAASPNQDVKATSQLQSMKTLRSSEVELGQNQTSSAGDKGPSARLKDDLQDLEAWLQLIASQDVDSAGHDRTPTLDEKRSAAKAKVSVYERALQHIQEPPSREGLLVGMMEEARLVWDASRLSAKFQTLLKQNPTCFGLWMLYVDHKQTAALDFTFDSARQTFVDCLDTLRNTRSALPHDHDDHAKLFGLQLYFLLRMTLFEQEAGYIEFAVCAWQALMEYGLLRPRTKVSSSSLTDDIGKGDLHAFEAFWDSEVPRIGEQGAHDQTHASQRPPFPITRSERKDVVISPTQISKKLVQWALLERQDSKLSRQSARTADDTGKEDPFRVVLFADINSCLFTPPIGISGISIVKSFLAFCHLPPSQIGLEHDHDYQRTNAFLHNENLYERDCEREGPFCVSIANFQPDQHTNFAGEEWLESFKEERLKADQALPVPSEFVSRVLITLVEAGVGGDELAEYSLAFELKVSPATVRKRARSYLKSMPSSLRLYNASALLEYRLANPNKGQDILIKSLQMIDQFKDQAKLQSVMLWRSWLWELMEMGKYVVALNRILLFGHESELQESTEPLENSHTTAQASLRLRTEKNLNDMRDDLLRLHLPQVAVAAAECLILFRYLQDPTSLEMAAVIFKAQLEHHLQYPSCYAEMLHQSFARLIFHHTTHTKLIRLGEVRTLLEESIAAYPQSTLFLSLYAWNESRLRVDDRLHSRFNSMVLKIQTQSCCRSIIPYSMQIDIEIQRSNHGTASVNTIRGAFERALGSDACVHCAGLWKRYFVFESTNGDVLRAEGVLYRALQACPWAKEISMLAFEHLAKQGGSVNEKKLHALVDWMEERGLRLYRTLEHY